MNLGQGTEGIFLKEKFFDVKYLDISSFECSVTIFFIFPTCLLLFQRSFNCFPDVVKLCLEGRRTETSFIQGYFKLLWTGTDSMYEYQNVVPKN